MNEVEYSEKTEAFATKPSSRAMLSRLVEMLDLPEASRILDVGCGVGIGMQQISYLHSVAGVDVNAHSVAIAKIRGLDVVYYDGSDFPRQLRCNFDAVILTNTLNHVPTPSNTLWMIYTSLRPGGQIGIINPNLWHRRFMHFMNQKTGYSSDPTIKHRFTATSLRKQVSEQFEDVNIEFMGRKKWGVSPNILLTARRPWV